MRLANGERLALDETWTWKAHGFPFRIVAFRPETKDERGRPMPTVVYQNIAGPAALRVVETLAADMTGRIRPYPTSEYTWEVIKNLQRIVGEHIQLEAERIEEELAEQLLEDGFSYPSEWKVA